ncbi:glycosyltransferase family 1 protein [Pseudokineococcus basanitobsidens]|uniref:Glycosyltransferase family 1 protein n=1 Tax=Pseudokineococcus basanitobsidens TaxID=1926649 RepID=A0ABU8RJP6_9ACTN
MSASPQGASGPPPLRWLLMAAHVGPDGQGGGIVRYTTQLAAALERRDDVELHVLAGEAADWFRAWLPADRVHAAPRLPRVATALVERLGGGPLGREGLDVVQGTKHLLPLRRRTGRATSVLTVHDMILLDRPRDFDRAKRTLLRRPYLASLREADVLAAVSRATADAAARWVPTAPARTAVVPLATSPTLLDAVPEPVPGLEGRPFALVVGDPSPRKNLPLVVDAWPDVVRQVPGAVLVVVGPDSWGATVHGARFAELAAEGSLVRLTGLPDAPLRWCYEHAAVVLCPSVAEGFGLPALEGLDLGAPVVTSRDAALVEATGDAAPHLPADDPGPWVEATVAALRRGRAAHDVARGAVRRPRTWDDVAAETVAAVRARRDR